MTEVELLGNGCELCGKVQDELQRLKNNSQDTLGRLEDALTDLQAKVKPGDRGCVRSCSQLDQEVRLLRDDVRSCTSRCQGKGQLKPASWGGSMFKCSLSFTLYRQYDIYFAVRSAA